MSVQIAQPVKYRAQTERVAEAYRVAVYIRIPVQRGTVGYAACQHVLIDEALDRGIVVTRSHVVQPAAVGDYAVFAGI